jgi:hypothetical protein
MVTKMEKLLNTIWVTTKQWEDGVVLTNSGEIILPPCEEKTQGQIRHKKQISYTKVGGRVFYTLDNILEYIERKKVIAVA